ncbi:hypothetical protein [Luteibacter sp. 621]|uniref:hypothetical protein n=1 Tax=Luteibacter sp. 621 TaxID=3373916 RepID=UPI003D1ACE16
MTIAETRSPSDAALLVRPDVTFLAAVISGACFERNALVIRHPNRPLTDTGHTP